MKRTRSCLLFNSFLIVSLLLISGIWPRFLVDRLRSSQFASSDFVDILSLVSQIFRQTPMKQTPLFTKRWQKHTRRDYCFEIRWYDSNFNVPLFSTVCLDFLRSRILHNFSCKRNYSTTAISDFLSAFVFWRWRNVQFYYFSILTTKKN